MVAPCSLIFVVVILLVLHLSIPRRENLLGVCFIKENKEHNVTSSRRAWFFQGASDLSAIIGMRIFFISEKDGVNMRAFGTPSVKPIVYALLFGGQLTKPFNNETTDARIALV